MVSKLKAEVVAMGTLDEKCRRVSVEAHEAKRKISVLETEL